MAGQQRSDRPTAFRVPISLGMICIAVLLPGSDLVEEGLLIGDATVEALGR